MSSAYHAETTPLLPEKVAQADDLENSPQPPVRRRRPWTFLSRGTIGYVIVELLAIGLAVKLFMAYRPFSTRLIGPRDPGDDSDSFNCAVEWSDVDKGHAQSSRPSSAAEAEFLEAFSWPGEEISAFTSFDLPASSPLLYFLSSGHLIAGSVTYDTTARQTDKVKVDIEMRYRTPEGRDLTDVCILSKKDGSSGVGIYGHGDVRDGPSHDLFVKFYVTVKFPGTPSNPLKLQNLETVMSIFGQKFGNLEGSVSFDKVSVETSNSPITVGSLFAKNVYLSDTNTPIIGRFNVTEALKLSTANAMIDVDAVLSNPDKDSKTTLSMSTSNAVIHSTIKPYSSTGKTGGQFVVDASTANAPIDINIPSAPSQSRLSLTASTSMSRVDLKLPLEYEGSITASTSWASTFMEIDTNAADPTGEGLTRKLEISKSTGSTINAKTWWGDDKARTELGKVDVSTSFGKISIEG